MGEIGPVGGVAVNSWGNQMNRYKNVYGST